MKSNLNQQPGSYVEYTEEELRIKIREGLSQYIAKGQGRAWSYYPKVSNLGNLLPIALKEANAIKTDDILIIYKMENYLADLNQSEVFYNLSLKTIDDAEWEKFRDRIRRLLCSAPIDYTNKEQIKAFRSLFDLISLETGNASYSKPQEKAKLLEKVGRIVKYRTSNTTSILDAMTPEEMVAFARSLLIKWDSGK